MGAEPEDYRSTPCQSWRGHVELRWCAFENTGLALESAGLEGGGPALDSGAWGWCSETQDGKRLCPLQTGLRFLQEEPAWTHIECSSGQVCVEPNAANPESACVTPSAPVPVPTEKIVSDEMCPDYEPKCFNVQQPQEKTTGTECIHACKHWTGGRGNVDMRWCPTKSAVTNDAVDTADTAW